MGGVGLLLMGRLLNRSFVWAGRNVWEKGGRVSMEWCAGVLVEEGLPGWGAGGGGGECGTIV